jgi:hypothetical protein
MLCSARVVTWVGGCRVVVGDFSHTTVAAVADIIEAYAYGNESWQFDAVFVFQRNKIDTCAG